MPKIDVLVVMLLTLHKIARRLKWCRSLTLVLIIAGFAGVAISLFAAEGSLGQFLEPALVLSLWGMMLFSFIQLFQQIPPPVLPHDDFITKLGSRLILAGYTILAFLIVVVTCVLVWMSFRLISLQ